MLPESGLPSRCFQPLLVLCSVLAAIIYTSATLHAMEVPTPQIGAVLAAITVANWAVFDRTPQGALLAVLCGVGAPLSEVVLNSVFGMWHYPREDLPGMVSWCDPSHRCCRSLPFISPSPCM